MVAKSYSPEFEGYWREPNIDGIPAKSGVYCVSTCVYDSNSKTVDLRRLVYIGEGENVHDRVANHDKWLFWRRHRTPGQEVCISFAGVAGTDRERVEAPLIYEHKRPENEEYKNAFPFDETTIQTSGRNALLKSSFTVRRTSW